MRFETLPISPDAFTARLDSLRFDFGKWDLHVAGKPTVPRGALVLSQAEHRQVVQDAEGLAALAAKARHHLRHQRTDSQDLGIDARLEDAAAQEAEAPLVTRIDFFRTPDGWQVSEFNDDCPGGYNEAIGLPALLGDALPPGTGVAGDLPEALVRLGQGVVAGSAQPDAPLAILFATGYSEDLQVAELLRALLENDGVAAVCASPANVALATEAGGRDGLLTVLDAPAAGILRFFPADWLLGLPNWRHWAALGPAGVRVANPLSSCYTQSKAIHAWLHADWAGNRCVVASAAEGDLVTRLLPATRRLDARTHAVALAAPHRYVLKPAFGRMGEGVVMGHEASALAWSKRLTAATRASRTRPFVVQDRFDAERVETAPGTTMTACLGAYVVDGTFAGYYSRLAHGPVVAYDAANVLTVVEGL